MKQDAREENAQSTTRPEPGTPEHPNRGAGIARFPSPHRDAAFLPRGAAVLPLRHCRINPKEPRHGK